MQTKALWVLAYTLIGAGLTIWFDALRGCTYNADQIVGLTVAFSVAAFLVQQIVNTLVEHRQRRQPQIDITTLFEEI